MREIPIDLECQCPKCGGAETVCVVAGDDYQPMPPLWGRGVRDIVAKCGVCNTGRTLVGQMIMNGQVLG